MLVQHGLGHTRDGERRHRAAHVALRITILQASRQARINGWTRNHAAPTPQRNGARQLPARNTAAPPALDDGGISLRRDHESTLACVISSVISGACIKVL